MKLLIFALATASIASAAQLLPDQVTASGNLVCNGHRMSGLKVEIVQRNTKTPWRVAATASTDDAGFFNITGVEETPMGPERFDPIIRIFHGCQTNQGGNGNCVRVGYYYIPGKFNDEYKMSLVILDQISSFEQIHCGDYAVGVAKDKAF